MKTALLEYPQNTDCLVCEMRKHLHEDERGEGFYILFIIGVMALCFCIGFMWGAR